MMLVSGNSAARTKVLDTGCKTCWKHTINSILVVLYTCLPFSSCFSCTCAGWPRLCMPSEQRWTFGISCLRVRQTLRITGVLCLPCNSQPQTISLTSYFFSLVPLPLLQLLKPFSCFSSPLEDAESSVPFPREGLIFLLQFSHLVYSFHVLEDALEDGRGENIREWPKSFTQREIRLCHHCIV